MDNETITRLVNLLLQSSDARNKLASCDSFDTFWQLYDTIDEGITEQSEWLRKTIGMDWWQLFDKFAAL